jgi:hypothetical protein
MAVRNYKQKGPDPKPGPLFSRSSAGITRIRFMGLISGYQKITTP